MKRVVINQSNYIPWKGFFDLIHDADQFVFYDDVQFTKHDWRNRNLVKGPSGPQWLTVPVGTRLDRRISDVTMGSHGWQIKHWKTLSQLYSRASYFKYYRSIFEHVYLERQWSRLSELNQFLTQTIARDMLGIKTEFADSEQFVATGRGQERVLNLLKAVGADRYVSGPAGRAYLEPDRFREAGIALVWKDYSGYPEYPQFFPPFQHAVSILDVIFHTGPDASYYVWGWRADAVAHHETEATQPKERVGHD